MCDLGRSGSDLIFWAILRSTYRTERGSASIVRRSQFWRSSECRDLLAITEHEGTLMIDPGPHRGPGRNSMCVGLWAPGRMKKWSVMVDLVPDALKPAHDLKLLWRFSLMWKMRKSRHRLKCMAEIIACPPLLASLATAYPLCLTCLHVPNRGNFLL